MRYSRSERPHSSEPLSGHETRGKRGCSRLGVYSQTLAGAFSLTALAAILVWSGVAPFGKYALEDFPTWPMSRCVR